MTTDARYALFLNPDTEILEGTFEELVAGNGRAGLGRARRREAGDGGRRTLPYDPPVPERVAGVGRGARFRAVARSALRGSVNENSTSSGLRHGRSNATGRPAPSCLQGGRRYSRSGIIDERFFLFRRGAGSCLRIQQAGWEIRHLPLMTIVHHAGKAGLNPRLEAQNAYARALHARKHFSPAHRAAFLAAVTARYGVRALYPGQKSRKMALRLPLRVIWGLEPPPFEAPPGQSVRGPAGGAA